MVVLTDNDFEKKWETETVEATHGKSPSRAFRMNVPMYASNGFQKQKNKTRAISGNIMRCTGGWSCGVKL